jgi:hypothetical protein
VLIELNQARTPAGWRNSAWSTARGELGLRHNVATATSTYADAGNDTATAAGETSAVACGEAARLAVGAATGATGATGATVAEAADIRADGEAEATTAEAAETTAAELPAVTAATPCEATEAGAACFEHPARKISATIPTPANRRPAISPG